MLLWKKQILAETMTDRCLEAASSSFFQVPAKSLSPC